MRVYTKKLAFFLVDLLLINIAIYISLNLRFDQAVPENFMEAYSKTFIYLTILSVAIYYLFGLYSSLWRYASVDELMKIAFATATGSLAVYLLGLMMDLRFPRSVYGIYWAVSLILIGSSRFSHRVLRSIRTIKIRDLNTKTKIMIIGAGDAGAIVINELKKHTELDCIPTIVIDDDKIKHGASTYGVPVIGGRDKIIKAAEQYMIDEIIIAIPSAPKSEIRDILKICKETKCRLKTLPGIYEIINEKVTIKQIRDINIEDLLGREEVVLNSKEIASYLENEIVLVTGGGGSIGSELCRQIVRYNPRQLIILDIYENNIYDLQNEFIAKFGNKLNIKVIIASIRDKHRLREIFDKYRPGVVFHSAAHKHVPLMEDNPGEAIKNNIFGTLNIVECADFYKAKKFVMISTDKAVNPTNIMGATKRVAEIIVQSFNAYSQTEFVAVRFGNVLGSNGSVIPLFKKQIQRGGPVTVTHPEVTRYFMTIPEAAQLVIQAGAMARGGEVFILDMGEPIKILDLAKDLIKLSGFNPGVDIKIEFTGLRQGEKLYEELLLEEEGLSHTSHKKIFVGKSMKISREELKCYLNMLENSLEDEKKIRICLKKIVPNYNKALDEAAITKLK